MSKVLVTTRAITQKERPWLDAEVPASTVWSYDGAYLRRYYSQWQGGLCKAGRNPFL